LSEIRSHGLGEIERRNKFSKDKYARVGGVAGEGRVSKAYERMIRKAQSRKEEWLKL
jgi:hypothetical protein